MLFQSALNYLRNSTKLC